MKSAGLMPNNSTSSVKKLMLVILSYFYPKEQGIIKIIENNNTLYELTNYDHHSSHLSVTYLNKHFSAL